MLLPALAAAAAATIVFLSGRAQTKSLSVGTQSEYLHEFQLERDLLSESPFVVPAELYVQSE